MTETDTAPPKGPGPGHVAPDTARRAKRVGLGRVWRAQVRRGLAWPTVVVLAGAGVAMLFTRVSEWAANWSGLANYLRTMIIILGPIVAAFACWEAGRDRRRRTGELLATTPRAAWRRELMGFSAVAAAAAVGYLLVFVGAAVVVAPAASYTGGRWWATLALGVVAILAMASVGWAVGRAVGFRLAAPVLGVVSYAVIGYGSYFNGGWVQLLPPGRSVWGSQLTAGAIIGGTAFFVFAATAVFIASTARGRHIVLAAIPAAVAVAVAIPLSAGNSQSWWESDPGAQRPVCSDSGRVCVWASHAGLLDAVSEQAEPLLAKITTAAGPQYRLIELPRDRDPGPADIPIGLINQVTVTGRGLNDPGRITNAIISSTIPNCPMPEATSSNPDPDPWDDVMNSVHLAATNIIAPPAPFVDKIRSGPFDGASAPEPGSLAAQLVTEYHAAPAETGRAWLSAEIQAAKTCDRDALHSLANGIDR